MAANGGTRRGSSIFAASAAGDGDVSGPYGRPAYLYGQPDGNLLVDFPPTRDQHQGQSGSGGRFSLPSQSDDMDIGDSQYEHPHGAVMNADNGNGNRSDRSSADSTAVTKPRLGEAARMEELMNSHDLPGGPNHRPLVGGFAAAAYEAAKAHHYSVRKPTETDADGNEKPMDRPPPSI